MPTPDSRIARAFIRAALRSKESHVRQTARAICRTVRTYDPNEYGRTKPLTRADETANISDRAAIDLAARITGALCWRDARQDRLC